LAPNFLADESLELASYDSDHSEPLCCSCGRPRRVAEGKEHACGGCRGLVSAGNCGNSGAIDDALVLDQITQHHSDVQGRSLTMKTWTLLGGTMCGRAQQNILRVTDHEGDTVLKG
jgi:hypothetical protein